MTNQVNLDLIWASSGGVSDPGDVKYTTGWITEIPTFENFNFVLQNHSRNQLALAEKPAHVWNANISYIKGAIVVAGDKTYYCQLANKGQNPETDSTDSYWKFSQCWGETSTYSAKVGAINNVMFSRAGKSWLGQDQTIINSDNALILLADRSTRSNILFGMSDGELILKEVGNVIEPDGSNIMPKSDLNPSGAALRIFHEGHPPTQEEVAGTISEAPDDQSVYGRANKAWIPIQSTDALKPFQSGTKMLFVEGSAPEGWTQDNSDRANNRMLRVVIGVGDNPGGSDDCIFNNKVPVHRHSTRANSTLDSHSHHLKTTSDPINTGHKHNFDVTSKVNSAGHTHTSGTLLAVGDGNHAHSLGDIAADGSGQGMLCTGGEFEWADALTSYAGQHEHSISGSTGVNSVGHTHNVTGTTGWQDQVHTHEVKGDTDLNTETHFHDNGMTDLNADKTYTWDFRSQPGGTSGNYIQSNTGDWAPRYLDILICIAN